MEMTLSRISDRRTLEAIISPQVDKSSQTRRRKHLGAWVNAQMIPSIVSL